LTRIRTSNISLAIPPRMDSPTLLQICGGL